MSSDRFAIIPESGNVSNMMAGQIEEVRLQVETAEAGVEGSKEKRTRQRTTDTMTRKTKKIVTAATLK